MRASTPLIVQLLCLSLIASACSLWAAEARNEAMHWLTDEHCEQLALANSSGMPMDAITVEGWPGAPDEDWGVVAAQIITGDESWFGKKSVTVVADWLTPAALLVPVHPSEDPEGGTVDVRFGQYDEDNVRWCDQTHALVIEPLPPADADQGIEAQLVEAGAQLDVVAARFDTTGRELAELDPSEVSAELLVPYISARLIHDDDGIRGMLDDLDAAERDLADRVAAQARQRATLDPESYEVISSAVTMPAGSATAAFEAQVTPHRPLSSPAELAVSLAAAPVRTVQAPMVLASADVMPPAVQAAASTAGGCTEVSFAGLAALLGKQMSGEAMSSATSHTSVQVITFVAGLPLTKGLGLSITLTAWVAKANAQYLAHMLPSELQSTLFDYDAELWEDEPAPASHRKFTMQFTSTGWDPGPIMAELAMIVAQQGMSKALRRYVFTAPSGGHSAQSGVRKAVDEWLLANASDISSESPGWLVSVLAEALDTGGLTENVARFDPRCWAAVNEYPSLEPSLERTWLGAIGPAEWQGENWYEATDLGIGTIEMVWTAPIGQHLLGPVSSRARSMTGTFTSTADVNVLPIQVDWTPDRQRVSPGDVVSLTVTTSNAHDPSLWLSDSLGQLDVEVTGDASDVTYQVPEEWDGKSPIELIATSLSMQGLRDWTHPAYRGEVTGSAWLVGEPCDPLQEGAECIDDTSPCPGCMRSVGDPHLTTLDGAYYSFQGAGEYVLLRSRDGAVEIQARQEPWGSAHVSENTAAAVRAGDQRVGFYITDDGDFRVLVDDEEVDASRLTEPRTLQDGTQLWGDDGVFGVTLSDSTRVFVIPGSTLSIFVEPSAQLVANAQGLLAATEGGAVALPALPDGTRLPQPKDRDEQFEFLYRRLGDSWRVTDTSTLFTYAPGLGPDDYYRADFPSPVEVRFSLDDLTADERAVGEAACGGITDVHLAVQCVFDVGVTGTDHWTEEYRAADRFVKTREEARRLEAGADTAGTTSFSADPMAVVVVRTLSCPDRGHLDVILRPTDDPASSTGHALCLLGSQTGPPWANTEAYIWLPHGGTFDIEVVGRRLTEPFDIRIEFDVGPAPTVVEMNDLEAAGGHQHRLAGIGDAVVYMVDWEDRSTAIDVTVTGTDVACSAEVRRFHPSYRAVGLTFCLHANQTLRGQVDRTTPLVLFTRTNLPADVSLTLDDG